MLKPFSQACENNSGAILAQLQRLLKNAHSVLEIGSGTGQHAVYFSESLPQLYWQTSDVSENHQGINLWLDDYEGENCLRPILIDVEQAEWRGDDQGKKSDQLNSQKYNAVFTANTLHIMSWLQVEYLFHGLTDVLDDGALFIVYGPFNYEGRYTSDSNAQFDQWLQSANPQRGIRDIEKVNKLANDIGLIWQEDIEMPANNRLQVWRYKV